MNRKQERELALSLNFSQPLLQWLKTGLCFPALARRVTGEDVEVLIGALPSLPLGVAAKWSYLVLHFVADPKWATNILAPLWDAVAQDAKWSYRVLDNLPEHWLPAVNLAPLWDAVAQDPEWSAWAVVGLPTNWLPAVNLAPFFSAVAQDPEWSAWVGRYIPDERLPAPV